MWVIVEHRAKKGDFLLGGDVLSLWLEGRDTLFLTNTTDSGMVKRTTSLGGQAKPKQACADDQ